MELAVVRQAVTQLQAQGVPLDTITAPQVRELTGTGSYTTILEHWVEPNKGT
jgi:Plasmid replication region DNA-binding N-term